MLKEEKNVTTEKIEEVAGEVVETAENAEEEVQVEVKQKKKLSKKTILKLAGIGTGVVAAAAVIAKVAMSAKKGGSDVQTTSDYDFLKSMEAIADKATTAETEPVETAENVEVKEF